MIGDSVSAKGPVARSRSGPGGGSGGGGSAAKAAWAADTTPPDPSRPKGTASLTLLLLYEIRTLAAAGGPACVCGGRSGVGA